MAETRLQEWKNLSQHHFKQLTDFDQMLWIAFEIAQLMVFELNHQFFWDTLYVFGAKQSPYMMLGTLSLSLLLAYPCLWCKTVFRWWPMLETMRRKRRKRGTEEEGRGGKSPPEDGGRKALSCWKVITTTTRSTPMNIQKDGRTPHNRVVQQSCWSAKVKWPKRSGRRIK